jgi:hypothetical protein
MSFFDLFRRKKSLDEATRREMLLRKGRITEGIILDHTINSDGEVSEVYYTYSVSGSEYESSQKLNDEQRNRSIDYAAGARVTVRYDPGKPGNSIVV